MLEITDEEYEKMAFTLRRRAWDKEPEQLDDGRWLAIRVEYETVIANSREGLESYLQCDCHVNIVNGKEVMVCCKRHTT